MNMFKIFENDESVACYLNQTWKNHGEIVRYGRKDLKARKHLGDYDEVVIIRYACKEHRRQRCIVRVNKGVLLAVAPGEAAHMEGSDLYERSCGVS